MQREGFMRQAKGFTLIELLIVVVVVAILASVAWPSYQSYLLRSRRADAQSLMLSIVNKEQQYLLDARQYTDVVGAGGLAIALQGWDCTLNSAKTCGNSYYDIAVTLNAGPPPSFTVTSTPKVATSQNVDGTLVFISTGGKTRMVGGVDKGW
jgi:type IV pilus assembly protein PilE